MSGSADIPQLVRNAARFREITTILAKYGLAGWLGNVRADWVQKLLSNADGERLADRSQNERIRMALSELGTTFVKLGQILSTRPDLVGPELAEELSKLQTGTPPDPPESVRENFVKELGEPPEKLFLEFDEQAMASASIAQIHRAVTKDGKHVVVKIQHTGIEDGIRNDLEIMTELAKLAERFAPQLQQMQPLETATEFSRTLLRELDFRRESRNMQQFIRNFQTDDGVRFPTPYPELSAQRVLTMDRLEGIGLSDADALRHAGLELEELAERGANMFIEMIFRDGFYHADPHPGNLMVLSGDVIGVLDCGMVGRLDDELREQIEDMLLAAVDQDAGRLTSMVVSIGRLPAGFDRELLQTDVDEFLMDYRDQSIDEFDLSGALNGLIALIRRHQITLPARIALLLKVLVMLEGTSRQLSPKFSLAELLEPYRTKAIKRRLSPQRILKKLSLTYHEWNHLIETLPGDLADVLGQIKRGSFDVHLEHRRLESTVNRLVLGIISAAAFVGSATLWSREVPPVYRGYSLPGVLGCAAAVFLAGRVIIAIKKSGNLAS